MARWPTCMQVPSGPPCRSFQLSPPRLDFPPYPRLSPRPPTLWPRKRRKPTRSISLRMVDQSCQAHESSVSTLVTSISCAGSRSIQPRTSVSEGVGPLRHSRRPSPRRDTRSRHRRDRATRSRVCEAVPRGAQSSVREEDNTVEISDLHPEAAGRLVGDPPPRRLVKRHVSRGSRCGMGARCAQDGCHLHAPMPMVAMGH